MERTVFADGKTSFLKSVTNSYLFSFPFKRSAQGLLRPLAVMELAYYYPLSRGGRTTVEACRGVCAFVRVA